MKQCDGCHARAVAEVRTKWGRFMFCNHCLQKHMKALKPISTQYLEKVYDHAVEGI